VVIGLGRGRRGRRCGEKGRKGWGWERVGKCGESEEKVNRVGGWRGEGNKGRERGSGGIGRRRRWGEEWSEGGGGGSDELRRSERRKEKRRGVEGGDREGWQ